MAQAVDSMRDLAGGSVDDAKARAADLAKAAVEHGQEALAGSEQAARDGAESLEPATADGRSPPRLCCCSPWPR